MISQQQLRTSSKAWLNLLVKITPILEQLKPRAEENLSDWATKNFYLSSEYSSYELYNYERRPYQKEVLDAIGDRANEKVVIVSATQMMKTMMLMIASANRIKNNPGAILHVMDTIINATKYSRQRLEPMIHDNQYLNRLIQEVKPKKADTVLMKKFVGGLLTIVGANSSSGLIFTSARDLFLDEVDSYPINVSDFGDPVELAIKRTTEFEDRQIIMASSPGNEGTSRIWPEFELTDQRYFFVPCPHCNELQKLEFGGHDKDYGLKWKNNDSATTYYLCVQCHQEIYNREKYWMLSQGSWRKTYPERINRPGFHINRLYSPSSTTSWDRIVEDWMIARKFSKQGDHERLKVFINTVLAELWTPRYDTPKKEVLLQRVEDYYSANKPQIPGKVCFLTAFVDVQDTWLYLKVKGWSISEESWLIEERTFQGNPTLQMVWNELDVYLTKAYQHPLGLNLHISVIGVDTGGHHSDAVYAFVKPRLIRRLNNGAIQKFYATKGWNTYGKPITDYKQHLNNKGNIPLFLIGTDTAKEVIFNRLAIENEEKTGPGYMHFNHFATAEYFEGLFSETIVRDKSTGQAKWIKTFERNEPLDGEVGNLFVLRLSRANLLNITEDLMKLADKAKQGNLFSEQQEQKPPQRQSWVDSWKL